MGALKTLLKGIQSCFKPNIEIVNDHSDMDWPWDEAVEQVAFRYYYDHYFLKPGDSWYCGEEVAPEHELQDHERRQAHGGGGSYPEEVECAAVDAAWHYEEDPTDEVRDSAGSMYKRKRSEKAAAAAAEPHAVVTPFKGLSMRMARRSPNRQYTPAPAAPTQAQQAPQPTQQPQVPVQPPVMTGEGYTEAHPPSKHAHHASAGAADASHAHRHATAQLDLPCMAINAGRAPREATEDGTIACSSDVEHEAVQFTSGGLYSNSLVMNAWLEDQLYADRLPVPSGLRELGAAYTGLKAAQLCGVPLQFPCTLHVCSPPGSSASLFSLPASK